MIVCNTSSCVVIRSVGVVTSTSDDDDDVGLILNDGVIDDIAMKLSASSPSSFRMERMQYFPWFRSCRSRRWSDGINDNR